MTAPAANAPPAPTPVPKEALIPDRRLMDPLPDGISTSGTCPVSGKNVGMKPMFEGGGGGDGVLCRRR